MLNQLQDELKSAMKNSEKTKILALRNYIGKLKAAQIEKGEKINKEESIKVLKTVSKQLKESIKQYKHGGRDDLATKEKLELDILEKFLPENLSENKIIQMIDDIIIEVNAKSIQDMGKVMGKAMKEFGDLADGNIVKNIVKGKLSQ